MKYVYFTQKREVLEFCLFFIFVFLGAAGICCVGFKMFFRSYKELAQELELASGTVMAVIIVALIGIILLFAEIIYEWGFNLAKYSLSSDGIWVKIWFVSTFIKWSEFYYWIVTTCSISSVPDKKRCIIGIRSDEIPDVIKREKKIGNPPIRNNKTLFSAKRKEVLIAVLYTDSRYEEFKKHFDKYGVQQITRDGIGRMYGAEN